MNCILIMEKAKNSVLHGLLLAVNTETIIDMFCSYTMQLQKTDSLELVKTWGEKKAGCHY